ncbi:MAG: phosphoglycerate dehydrogenase [Candidatus Lernaella stagnicola]|nr:phosphoglycerate dehydrogenase [Candidatus Lernaella stagnicola]
MRVLVSDKFSEKGLAILESTPDIQVDYRTGLKGAELAEAIAEADALIVRSSTKATAELIAGAPKLKAIGRAGIGVDNIDLAAASRRGIVVMNTPGGNNVATGEHAISMMMALSRRIPQAHGALKNGRWEKSQNIGVEVFGKTLGVLGFGNVGRIVVSRALGLQMRVLVHDPFVVPDKIVEAGAIPATFEELLAKCDYVSVHVPKGEKTLNLINHDTIAKMKDGVRIINCARGGIVNEQDLYDALQSGKVAGAAVDVFVTEPCTDSPLFELDNVVVTPHLGASTSEAQDNVAIAISEQIIDYLRGGVIKNPVNAPQVAPELLERMRPVLSLAHTVGSFVGQLLDRAPRDLKIFIGGDFALFPDAPLQIAVLLGVLPHFGIEDINPVSAPYLAKERGVSVATSKRESLQDFVNVIGVKAVFEDGTEIGVQGSIPAPGEERIVRVFGYAINVDTNGYLIVITNHDVPGVVGEVGTLLGQRGINIGQLRLARHKDLSEALMVVTVDGDITPEVVAEFGNLPNVTSARVVHLVSE